ncbi:M23 family metallopeptidase [Ornithinimicrobium sp. LYQ92]|uniref:M23 family metallopeptidase n=1 Tax=Serinicoccus sp. LYQ92 TaxID=3378798 RepID=UPI003852EA41
MAAPTRVMRAAGVMPAAGVMRAAGALLVWCLVLPAAATSPAGGSEDATNSATGTATGDGGAAAGVAGPGRAMMTSQVLGTRETAGTARDRVDTAVWGWPLTGVPDLVHGFDPPEHRWSAGHRGIDLAGVAGEPVLAVQAGVVTYSGVVAGVGVVSLTHTSGLRSTYQPVSDRPERGDRVARGAVLGRLDVGGHCTPGDCLHLGAVRGRDGYVDPMPLLLGVELTLRPVGR